MSQQHLITQLLTLFFSGVYISTKDLLDIAHKLELDFPAKSRELLLKNLFAEAQNQNKLYETYDMLIALLQARVREYKKLTALYPHIQNVSTNWINKANTMIRLIQQQKRGSIYE
ncbi:MAG: hypothetical protein AB1389_07165 [Campylobacterota bacterium]